MPSDRSPVSLPGVASVSVPAGHARAFLTILRQLAITAALLGGLALSGALAQAPVVDMSGLAVGDIRSEVFVLDAPQVVQIHAVGAAPGPQEGNWFTRTFGLQDVSFDREDRPVWQGNAWILDARTRTVVWELRRTEAERAGRELRRFDGTLRLPAGTYEAYYASFPAEWQGRSWTWFADDRSARARGEGLVRDFRLTIRGENGARHASADELSRVHEEFNRTAIVSLTRARASTTQRIGFKLDQATELEIYNIGEVRKDGAFDYGAIVDADTRETIWRLDYAFSRHAGGANKNRVERRTLKLPAGRYAALYASDDSHHPSEWNDAPPYDPSFYGLTIRVSDPSEKAKVRTFAWDPWPSGTPAVALVGVGDRDSRAKGFRLTRAASVRIYAMGEGSDDHLVDRGWIIDATTRRRVWSMDGERTGYAGGAEKNRVVERVLRLEPGSYLVHYTSDDSHSFDNWNAAPPLDPEHWGISVYPATDADRSAFAAYEEPRDASAIARIVRVGDDGHDRARFTLDDDTRVNVYAIGEGNEAEMNDYAWIEDARTREVVWDMRNRPTTHAGGARKNRQVNEVIRLAAGDYILHFRSDGSHSYEDWNDDPPDDPEHWGVTISRASK
jgi:hypothetical protein